MKQCLHTIRVIFKPKLCNKETNCLTIYWNCHSLWNGKLRYHKKSWKALLITVLYGLHQELISTWEEWKFFRCSALVLPLTTAVCAFLFCEILRNHTTNRHVWETLSQLGSAMTVLVWVEEASVVGPSAPFSLGHEETASQPEQKHQPKILLWAWFFCGTCFSGLTCPKAQVFQPLSSLVRFCLAHKNECLQPLLPHIFVPKCVIRWSALADSVFIFSI